MELQEFVVILESSESKRILATGRVIALYTTPKIIEIRTESPSLPFAQVGDVLHFEEGENNGKKEYFFLNRVPGSSLLFERVLVQRLLGMSFKVGGWIS